MSPYGAPGSQQFRFGKHRNRSFEEVRRCDPSYCTWALSVQQPSQGLAEFVNYLQEATADVAGNKASRTSVHHDHSIGGQPMQVGGHPCWPNWPSNRANAVNASSTAPAWRPEMPMQGNSWNPVGAPRPQGVAVGIRPHASGHHVYPVNSATNYVAQLGFQQRGVPQAYVGQRPNITFQQPQPVASAPGARACQRPPLIPLNNLAALEDLWAQRDMTTGAHCAQIAADCRAQITAESQSAASTGEWRDATRTAAEATSQRCWSRLAPGDGIVQDLSEGSASTRPAVTTIDISADANAEDSSSLVVEDCRRFGAEQRLRLDSAFGNEGHPDAHRVAFPRDTVSVDDVGVRSARDQNAGAGKHCQQPWLGTEGRSSVVEDAPMCSEQAALQGSDASAGLRAETMHRGSEVRSDSESQVIRRTTRRRRKRRAIESSSDASDRQESHATKPSKHPRTARFGCHDVQSEGTESRPGMSAVTHTSHVLSAEAQEIATETVNESSDPRTQQVQNRKARDDLSESDNDLGECIVHETEGSLASDVRAATRLSVAAATLQNLHAIAEVAVLDALGGRLGTLSQQERRGDVQHAIRQGCMNMKTNLWGPDEDLASKSACFSELKEHQVVGVRWLLALHACVPGMVLADEMGLGKTLQVLCFLELLGSEKPSLIVVPASLLGNWIAEAAKWTPKCRAFAYHAANPSGRRDLRDAYFDSPDDYQIVVTTPGMIHNKEERKHFFGHIEFDCMVVDEAHTFKNAAAAKYRDLHRHVRCHRRVLLTGTPVQNSLGELVVFLNFALNDGRQVGKSIACALQEIADDEDETALQRLQAISGPLILRRLKADVLAALPRKQGIVVYCDLEGEQRRQYEKELASCRKERMTSQGLKAAFHSLRRICLHPLLDRNKLSDAQLSRMVDDLIRIRPDFASAPRARVESVVQGWSDFDKHKAAAEYGLDKQFLVSKDELLGSAKTRKLLEILKEQGAANEKTLVFSQFTQYLDVIEAVLDTTGIAYCRLDGKTPIEARQSLASTFQAKGGPLVFLVSTKAGGVGLNLTAANTVVMLDLDFNPQNTRQAEDRVHRLGQTKDVLVHYLICRGTVEEMVLKRNIQKLQLDQSFGAKQAALEVAASAHGRLASSEPETCEHRDADRSLFEDRKDGVEDGGGAAAEAKDCEAQVLADLGQFLVAAA